MQRSHSLRCRPTSAEARLRSEPRAYAPSRLAYASHALSWLPETWAWRNAAASRSRARWAWTAVALAVLPSITATVLGDSRSTSVCQSTTRSSSGSSA